ncbi:MAG: GTPase HflX [bacterium]
MDKAPPREKAILAGFDDVSPDPDEGTFDELSLLADTAGAAVVERVVQRRKKITPDHFMGRGKIEELAERVRQTGAGLVVFNHELSPLQFRNIERKTGVKVVDRTQLILDIFAMRAGSREAKIQVELAQLEYLLPRITGFGTELSRLGAGIGTRGPGETKLEMDRRRIRRRISTLRKRLTHVERSRAVQKQRRLKTGVPVVALVGYTNAGKTTLFNAVCGESAFVEDRLFATLDPLSRTLFLPRAGRIIAVDTVGFIRGLPVKLVEAFKSTLEEAVYAHVLVHVADVSHPECRRQMETVRKLIAELAAADTPVVTALNKIDLVGDAGVLEVLKKENEPSVAVSALNKIDLDKLKETIDALITRRGGGARARETAQLR